MRFTPTGVGTAEGLVSIVTDFFRFTPTGVGTAFRFVMSVAVNPGSPPRAWGRLSVRNSARGFTRFTPTGVGTADVTTYPLTNLYGSPPRAWGRRFAPSGASCVCSVHPHGRGDGSRNKSSVSPIAGSPPRAWGRRVLRDHMPENGRFTPTGVGTALAMWIAALILPVHPHGRGDGENTARRDAQQDGSPPRAWGRLLVAGADLLGPAVHPHGRGDGYQGVQRFGLAIGSPPRAWGRLKLLAICLAKVFGSPPRAWGRRSGSVAFVNLSQVHPHGRGDGDRDNCSVNHVRRFTPTGVGTAKTL